MIRIRDERRSAELSSDPALSVEGVMRVRSVEAMVKGRGLRHERREPHSLLIRRGVAAVETVAIPAGSEGPSALLMLAAPVLAIAAIAAARFKRRSS